MTQNIVIVGASFAGVIEAHYLLQKVIPTLPNKDSYHITIVDYADKFYNNVPTPRAVANSTMMPYDKFFFEYKQVFSKYTDKQITFVQARVTGVDLASRTVSLNKVADGSNDTLSYHALIIATGNKYESGLWWVKNSTADTQKAMAELESSLAKAKSVLIAGGGPVGVETAGEVGEQLNGAAGYFASEPAHKKAEVTILSGQSKLLPVLRPALAEKAERFLKRVGVNTLHNVKVVSSTPAADGKTTVQLSDNNTKTVDVYIDATGSKPNTDWAPAAILDERRRIKTHPTNLRVEAAEAGERVYAIGDVASFTNGGIMNIYGAVPVLGENLKRDLLASSGEKTAATGADKEFKNTPTETQFVPVGRGKGVAAAFGWKVPSFFVWLIKGRDYMVGMSAGKILGTSV